jgi:hypothetical protein
MSDERVERLEAFLESETWAVNRTLDEVERLKARVAALTAAIRAVKQYTEQEPIANYCGAVTMSPEWFRMLTALDAQC